MSWKIALLLFVGAVPQGDRETNYFENYTKAYHAAREAGKPLLVILNPDSSEQSAIPPGTVYGTGFRRELIDNYVVAVLDAGTQHGRRVHKLFGSDELPHVSVIDKNQEYQIYTTSGAPSEPLWDAILESFETGKPTASLERYGMQTAAGVCTT